MKLTKKDYLHILNYYNIENFSEKDFNSIKNKAEDIIAQKLCSCIKNVNNNKNEEKKAIAICTNNVVNKKKIKIYKFTCKKKPK